jgi:hypothetical protein
MGLVIWIMVLLCVTITWRKIPSSQIVIIEFSSLKLSFRKRKLSKFVVRFLIKRHSHRCSFSILRIDGTGEKRIWRKMGMTVIGMKFNQAVEKNVACDITSPLGPLPPLRNCTWQLLISFLMDQTECAAWSLVYWHTATSHATRWCNGNVQIWFVKFIARIMSMMELVTWHSLRSQRRRIK